jgi:hypothetical protein
LGMSGVVRWRIAGRYCSEGRSTKSGGSPCYAIPCGEWWELEPGWKLCSCGSYYFWNGYHTGIKEATKAENCEMLQVGL